MAKPSPQPVPGQHWGRRAGTEEDTRLPVRPEASGSQEHPAGSGHRPTPRGTSLPRTKTTVTITPMAVPESCPASERHSAGSATVTWPARRPLTRTLPRRSADEETG